MRTCLQPKTFFLSTCLAASALLFAGNGLCEDKLIVEDNLGTPQFVVDDAGTVTASTVNLNPTDGASNLTYNIVKKPFFPDIRNELQAFHGTKNILWDADNNSFVSAIGYANVDRLFGGAPDAAGAGAPAGVSTVEITGLPLPNGAYRGDSILQLNFNTIGGVPTPTSIKIEIQKFTDNSWVTVVDDTAPTFVSDAGGNEAVYAQNISPTYADRFDGIRYTFDFPAAGKINWLSVYNFYGQAYPYMVKKGRGVPATASDPCNEGEIASDATYIYVCVAANSWRRAWLNTW